MKILVAIDDSAGSRAVIKEVAQRPWPTGSTVTVALHAPCSVEIVRSRKKHSKS